MKQHTIEKSVVETLFDDADTQVFHRVDRQKEQDADDEDDGRGVGSRDDLA